MGQQQLLLIVLGVIVVGIAVVVGINLFNANSVESNRSAVVSDLNNIAAMAQAYYKKPASMGGGGNVFTGFIIPTKLASTANGTYSAAVSPYSVKITGTGTEFVDGGLKVTMESTVDSVGNVVTTTVH